MEVLIKIAASISLVSLLAFGIGILIGSALIVAIAATVNYILIVAVLVALLLGIIFNK